jgi:hypothetical protein
MESGNQIEGNRNGGGFVQQAARCSWIVCILILVGVGAIKAVAGAVVADMIALGLSLLGVGLAVFALVRRGGRSGILAQALAGLVLNGLILVIWTTNFTAARSRAKLVHASFVANVSPGPTSGLMTFHRGSLRFDYDKHYQARPGNTPPGAIELLHKDSQVTVTEYEGKPVAREFLRNMSYQLKAVFEEEHCEDIELGEFELVGGGSGAGGKIKVKFTPPGMKRRVQDIYLFPSETNSICLLHSYEEGRKGAAAMFQTVLDSFVR